MCRWSPLFPYFIIMIPIDCKKLITFPYTCLFALFERSLIIISWRAPNKSLLVNPLASNTSHSLFFSPLRSVINREQHENHLNNQTSHCKKIRNADHQSAHPSYWYKSGCVTLTLCIITLCFTSSSSNASPTSKERITREVLLLALYLPKSCTKP